MKKVLCCAAMLGLLACPVLADIVVSLDPAFAQTTVGGTVDVTILADIPTAEAIVGWGLDIDLAGTSAAIADPAIDVAIGAAWQPAAAADGDYLAGLLPFPPVPVSGLVELATVTFTGVELGLTDLSLAITPGDDTEGFAYPIPPGGFGAPVLGTGQIEVIPEPAAFALLAVAGLLIRRR